MSNDGGAQNPPRVSIGREHALLALPDILEEIGRELMCLAVPLTIVSILLLDTVIS